MEDSGREAGVRGAGGGGRHDSIATARVRDQNPTAKGGEGNQPTEATMPWESLKDQAKNHRWDGSLLEKS